MSQYSNSRKQMQLVTIITSIMVPVIIASAIMELYYLLGVLVAMELIFIVWTVMLIKSSKQNNSPTSKR